jgi:hypothetical protein
VLRQRPWDFFLSFFPTRHRMVDAREGEFMSRRQSRVSVEGFAFLLALGLLVGVLALVLYLGGPYYD